MDVGTHRERGGEVPDAAVEQVPTSVAHRTLDVERVLALGQHAAVFRCPGIEDQNVAAKPRRRSQTAAGLVEELDFRR